RIPGGPAGVFDDDAPEESLCAYANSAAAISRIASSSRNNHLRVTDPRLSGGPPRQRAETRTRQGCRRRRLHVVALVERQVELGEGPVQRGAHGIEGDLFADLREDLLLG